MGILEIEKLLPTTILLIIIGLIIGIGVFTLSEMQDSTAFSENTINVTSDFILADNGTETTLSNNPSTWTSATVKNRTWLDFDGTNDVLTVSDVNYRTISFWYKNSTTTNWQHIINTSNILYWNGTEVSELPLYPLFTDGTDWFFGKSDAGTFVEVDIDEITFYNDTINSTVITEIFNNER